MNTIIRQGTYHDKENAGATIYVPKEIAADCIFKHEDKVLITQMKDKMIIEKLKGGGQSG